MSSARSLTAELAHLPRLRVATAPSKPRYAHGVYLSGIGRLIARHIATNTSAVIHDAGTLLSYLHERGQVGALAKLSDLRDEALIAEDSATSQTRPTWRASLAMIREAIAELSSQPAAVREVA